MARELSFEDQLQTILNAERGYIEKAREIEKENKDASMEFKTHTDFQATPDDPYQMTLKIVREKPHRPQIDELVVSELEDRVKQEKPSVPAKKLDFDNNLDIVLDAAERYYEALQCEIVRSYTSLVK